MGDYNPFENFMNEEVETIQFLTKELAALDKDYHYQDDCLECGDEAVMCCAACGTCKGCHKDIEVTDSNESEMLFIFRMLTTFAISGPVAMFGVMQDAYALNEDGNKVDKALDWLPDYTEIKDMTAIPDMPEAMVAAMAFEYGVELDYYKFVSRVLMPTIHRFIRLGHGLDDAPSGGEAHA